MIACFCYCFLAFFLCSGSLISVWLHAQELLPHNDNFCKDQTRRNYPRYLNRLIRRDFAACLDQIQRFSNRPDARGMNSEVAASRAKRAAQEAADCWCLGAVLAQQGSNSNESAPKRALETTE